VAGCQAVFAASTDSIGITMPCAHSIAVSIRDVTAGSEKVATLGWLHAGVADDPDT
jgi:hypothetical protein